MLLLLLLLLLQPAKRGRWWACWEVAWRGIYSDVALTQSPSHLVCNNTNDDDGDDDDNTRHDGLRLSIDVHFRIKH